MSNVVQMSKYRREPEPWLNKVKAANHLGKSVSWVEKRAADSGLPFYRVGGMNFYRASELDEWVRSFAGPAA